MSRPISVNTEKIIDAARVTFLEKGYQDATTATIAERAGVSEGSLFKRFKGKAELFCAAMELPPLDIVKTLPALVGTGDPKENLRGLALEFVGFFEQLLPKVMMGWSHRRVMPWPPPTDAPPVVVLKALGAYFAAEMARGRVRRADPEITARLFVGSLWNYCFVQIISDDVLPMPKELYVRGLVEQLWHGMAPLAEAPEVPRVPPTKAARVKVSAHSLNGRRRRGSEARGK